MGYAYTVEAFNTATTSTNRMHDDAVAQSYGFRGGLVPGVDVWAYMTRPCVERWGEQFLTASTMEGRFVAPVYDGELVTVTLTDAGELTVTGPDDTVRATGRAELASPPPVIDIDAAPWPESAPAASPDLLAPGTTLGTVRFNYHRDPAASYLADVRETNPIYDGGAVGHPGFLARQANTILHGNVRLGPWIHVGTTAHHRGLVHDGDELEVRGRVVDEYERKGHRLVDLDVEITSRGTPVWSASHTAIWRPRRVSQPT